MWGARSCFVIRRHSVASDNGGPVIGGLEIANVEFAVFWEFVDNRSTDGWNTSLPALKHWLVFNMTINWVKKTLGLIDSSIFKRSRPADRYFSFIFYELSNPNPAWWVLLRTVSNQQRFKRSFYVFNYTLVFINRFLNILRQIVAEREGNKSGPGQLPKTIQTYHTISGRVSKLKAVINIEIFQEENLE